MSKLTKQQYEQVHKLVEQARTTRSAAGWKELYPLEDEQIATLADIYYIMQEGRSFETVLKQAFPEGEHKEVTIDVSLTGEEVVELLAVGGDAPKGKGSFQIRLVLSEVTNEGSENEARRDYKKEFLADFEDYGEALAWMNCLEAEARSSLSQAL